jgi:hypothetical protein
MTDDLLLKLREALAFDGEAHLRWLTRERLMDGCYEPSPQANARWENSRRAKVDEALVECCALIMECREIGFAHADWTGRADKALAKLRQALEG